MHFSRVNLEAWVGLRQKDRAVKGILVPPEKDWSISVEWEENLIYCAVSY